MADIENTPTLEQIQPLVLEALQNAFGTVGNSIEKSKGAKKERGQNQLTKATGATGIQGDIQTILAQLLIQLAKALGLKNDQLDLVFKEVLKLISKYQNTEGET